MWETTDLGKVHGVHIKKPKRVERVEEKHFQTQEHVQAPV